MRRGEALERLSASDPAQEMASVSVEELDRALASLLTRTRAEPYVRPRHPQRWIRPSFAAASLLAIAAAVAAFLLPFGTSAGPQNAWAKTVLARASAFLRNRIDSPLYTDVTTITRGGAPVQRTRISEAVTWQYGNRLASTTWALHPRKEIEESVFSGRRVEVFVAATNTIRESLNPPDGSIVYSPILSALLQLSPPLVQRLHLLQHLTSVAEPSAANKLMITLMHSHGTHVEHAMLRGSAAIRLSNPSWSGVIYLNPLTYATREIYRTYVPGTASHGSQTTIINTYRAVKPRQLPRNLFNLTAQHPGAKIRHIHH